MSHDANSASTVHLIPDRSRADSRPEIPTIITSDLSSNLSLSPPRLSDDDNGPAVEVSSHSTGQHIGSPSDHGLLSPASILKQGRTSLDVPNSPTGSAWSSDATHVPASPTSSIHSVPSVSFAPPSSLALRDNNPNERTGFSSLGLLHPPSQGGGHQRRPSNASSVGSETDPDSHSISMNTLAPSVSPTQSHFDAASDGGTTLRERSPSRLKSLKGKDVADDNDAAEEDPDKEPERPAAPDVSLDENIDPAPFHFKPYQLASLVDPKNIQALTDMGGSDGLLRGLGTHRKRGLSGELHSPAAHAGSQTNLAHGHGDGSSSGAGKGASQRHDPSGGGGTSVHAVPNIKITGDDGKEGEAELGDEERTAEDVDKVDADDQSAYAATMEDRHRVFGENVLPTRKTKSLLQLMWLALKDKVLVSNNCCSPCMRILTIPY